ncbi:MAG: Sensory box histidine kinase [Labilithrix sp.]|nr:Sensory box histidine kinase [Labilithrix sp.]
MTEPQQKSILVRSEETDVASLLRSSLAPLITQAKSDHIELRVETLGPVPSLAVDPEKLAWGVSTLVGNALRYVRRGTKERAGGSVLVHVTSDEATGDVSIAVQDDGPGIPEDKVPYLFARKDGAKHVAGLGLSLVRDVVEAHAGRIEVESRTSLDEHGTSITIHLPRQRQG